MSRLQVFVNLLIAWQTLQKKEREQQLEKFES
jgi:hypothetical protein